MHGLPFQDKYKENIKFRQHGMYSELDVDSLIFTAASPTTL